MKFQSALVLPLLSLSAGLAAAASAWGFEDGTLSVTDRSNGVGGGLKQKLSPSSPISNEIVLSAPDSLKIILTATENNKAKRPHQAFLKLHETATGLEESYPFSIKESGKGKVELTQKDLPFQFLIAQSALKAEIVIASFGSSTPYYARVFDLLVVTDPNAPPAVPEPPTRYGALSEIHHIFRADPKSPPKVVSAFFTLAVASALPVLFGAWLILGANFNHLGKAMGSDPVSHALFFGSIVAMEGIFFLYYTSWNLFQTLPAAGVVGLVAFLSGSRALSEVQARRLAGLR
ncbi:hypothetical protein MBLNU459_g8152t1 [Dothideomycetes sp. NU459]